MGVVNQSINQSIYTWVPKEQLRVAPNSTCQLRLVLTGLNGPCCVDQAFPSCHVLGIVPKHLALPNCMEMSTPHCGHGSYIILVPLQDKCWKPPPTLLALTKFALKKYAWATY